MLAQLCGDVIVTVVNSMRSINKSGVMYVMLLALFAYVCGLIAVHVQHVAFFAAMAFCQIVLAPVLFVYHTMSDKAVGCSLCTRRPLTNCRHTEFSTNSMLFHTSFPQNASS